MVEEGYTYQQTTLTGTGLLSARGGGHTHECLPTRPYRAWEADPKHASVSRVCLVYPLIDVSCLSLKIYVNRIHLIQIYVAMKDIVQIY